MPKLGCHLIHILPLIALIASNPGVCSARGKFNEQGLRFHFPGDWQVQPTSAPAGKLLVSKRRSPEGPIGIVHFSAPANADHAALHRVTVAEFEKIQNPPLLEGATETQKYPAGMTYITDFHPADEGNSPSLHTYLISFCRNQHFVVLTFHQMSDGPLPPTVREVLVSLRLVDQQSHARKLQVAAALLSALSNASSNQSAGFPAAGSGSLVGKWWTQGPAYLIFQADGSVQHVLAGSAQYTPRKGAYLLQGGTLILGWQDGERENLPIHLSGNQFTIVQEGVKIVYTRDK